MALRRLDFPQPDGPTISRDWPGSTVRSRARQMRMSWLGVYRVSRSSAMPAVAEVDRVSKLVASGRTRNPVATQMLTR
jgi:hypothetical protein